MDVYFINFGPSTLDVEISAYISATLEKRFKEIRQELLLEIASIVTQEGGEIATPTHVVELQGKTLDFDIALRRHLKQSCV